MIANLFGPNRRSAGRPTLLASSVRERFERERANFVRFEKLEASVREAIVAEQLERSLILPPDVFSPSEERAKVWPRLIATYPMYADYQRRTSREIPLVELTSVAR